MANYLDLGKVLLTPRGSYSSLETYSYLDFVLYNGASYVVKSKQNIVNITPNEDSEYWQKLSDTTDYTGLAQQYAEQALSYKNDAANEVVLAQQVVSNAKNEVKSEVLEQISSAKDEVIADVQYEIDISKQQALNDISEQIDIATNQANIAKTHADTVIEKVTEVGNILEETISYANIATEKAIEATNQAVISTQMATTATNKANEATEQKEEATRQANIAISQVALTTEQADIATTQATIATSKATIAIEQATKAENKANYVDDKIDIAKEEIRDSVQEQIDSAKEEIVVDAQGQVDAVKQQALDEIAGRVTYVEEQAENAAQQASIATAKATEATNQASLATNQAILAGQIVETAKTEVKEEVQEQIDYAKQEIVVDAQDQVDAVKQQALDEIAGRVGYVDEQIEIATQKATLATEKATEATNQANIATQQATKAENQANLVDEKITTAKTEVSQSVQDQVDAAKEEIVIDAQGEIDTIRAQVLDEISGQISLAENQANLAKGYADTALEKADIATTKATIASEKADVATEKANDSISAANSAETNANIATDKANVATSKADIATNMANIATDKADIAITKASEATTQQEEATRQANIAINQVTLATEQAEIATEKAEIATEKADIATSKANEATEQAEIATQKASQVSIDTASVTENTATVIQKTEIAIEKANIATEMATTATTQAGIATDQATEAKAQQEESTRQAEIATSQVSLATAQAEIATGKANIATAQAEIATNKADIATEKAEISTNQADIATAKAEKTASDSEAVENNLNTAIAQATIATEMAETATTQAEIATSQASEATTQQEEATRQAGIAISQVALATEQAEIATTQAGIATNNADISTTQAEIATEKANFANDKADEISVYADTAQTNANLAIEKANIIANQIEIATNMANTATTQAELATSKAQLAQQEQEEATRQAEIATAQAEYIIEQANIATEQANISSEKAYQATEQANIAIEKADETKDYADSTRRLLTYLESDVYLGDVVGATATASSDTIMLLWSDPEDVIYGDLYSAIWNGTKVVRKQGSVPTNQDDGVLILDSTVKNAYISVPYEDTGLEYGKLYYYRWFPYTRSGMYTKGTAVNVTPNLKKIYSVPVPNNTLTYTGFIQSMTFDDFDSNILEASGISGMNVDTYTATFVPKYGYGWSDNSTDPKTVSWQIYPHRIESTPVQTNTLTYTGYQLYPEWSDFDTEWFSITGDESGVDAGLYTSIFTPSDNYCWSNGSKNPIEVNWTINKTNYDISLPSEIKFDNSNTSSYFYIDSDIIPNVSIAISTPLFEYEKLIDGIIVSSTNMDSGNAILSIDIAETKNYYAKHIEISIIGDFVKIASWSNGTDTDICRMVDGSLNGEINLSDYWSVGDERQVSISAISTTYTGESQPSQDITLVLMDTGIYSYASSYVKNTSGESIIPIDTDGSQKTNVSFVVGMKNNFITPGYIYGQSPTSAIWSNSDRRIWCNQSCYEAIPSTIRPIFAEFLVPTAVKSKNSSGDTEISLQETSDYFALVAATEICGADDTLSCEIEKEALTQFAYYAYSITNRIKTNGGGNTSPSSGDYSWTRSPHKTSMAYFCCTDGTGSINRSRVTTEYGIAVFGCIK